MRKQVFVRNKQEVDEHAAAAMAAMEPTELLWLTYPKGRSKMKPDISRDTGWAVMANNGWRPVSLVSVDDTLPALRFRLVADVRARR